jgi:dimethylglycine dehydrogenase
MGFVSIDYAAPGTRLEVEILGEFYSAEVLGTPAYDANGANVHL